jgi:outer membrane immunogenic protein
VKKSMLVLAAVVALSVVALSEAALAADMPVKAPLYKAPPPYNWGGFYIGLNGGGGSAHGCWTVSAIQTPVVPAESEGCHNATGGLAGGQIGYRWQSANFVFGLEAQGDWANLRGSNTSQAPGVSAINQTTVSAFGLFTGQIGHAWNNALLYVKGGAAVTHDTYDGVSTITTPGFVVGSTIDQGTETRWGAAIGVGLDYGFAPGWSVGVEYDHLFMGTKTVTTTFVEGGVFLGKLARIESISQDVDIGLVRVNYTFGVR